MTLVICVTVEYGQYILNHFPSAIVPGRAPPALFNLRSDASGSLALPVARFTEVMNWVKLLTMSSREKAILEKKVRIY